MSSKLTDIDLLYLKAKEAASAGDIGTAAEVYSRMTELDPDDYRGWLELARIYFERLDDLNRAEEHFKRSVTSISPSAEAFLRYCDLLIRLNRLAEMNAMVNKAMEVQGVSKSTGLYKSGLLQESQGHYDDAVEFYRKAILASFSAEEIGLAEESVARCRTKKKYL